MAKDSGFYCYGPQVLPYTASVVEYLRLKDDSTKLSATIPKLYGYPLWDKAQYAESGGTVRLYVPLAKDGEKVVGGIWYFTHEGSTLTYRVLANSLAQPDYEQYSWMVDYFSQELYGHSTYSYKEVIQPDGYLKGVAQKMFTTHCVDMFINDYYKGTHCWDEFTGGSGEPDDTGRGSNFNPPTPPGGNGSTPPANPKPEVDTKDPSFNNTKADCIFQKLVGATSTTIYNPNTVVGKLLKDYWGKTTAGAHSLKFVVSPQKDLVDTHTNAQCETDKEYKSKDVTIRISREYMESCTNVELARTLIHESIHAEIYVRVKGFGAGASSDAEFAELFEKYKNEGNQRDHNIMAESDYVNLIAQGLKAYHDAGYMADFDANVTRHGGNFDYNQFYSMEAWLGLDKTKAFNSNKQNTTWSEDYLNYTKAPGKYIDAKDCK